MQKPSFIVGSVGLFLLPPFLSFLSEIQHCLLKSKVNHKKNFFSSYLFLFCGLTQVIAAQWHPKSSLLFSTQVAYSRALQRPIWD